MSREDIMGRLRNALEKAQAPDLPPVPEGGGQQVQDLDGLFARQLESAEGEVRRAGNSRQVLEALQDLFSSGESGRAVEEAAWEGLEVLRDHDIPFQCARGEVPEPEDGFWISLHPQGKVAEPVRLERRAPHREEAARAALSISSARWGIAETGSVYHQVGAGRSRLLSVLPPQHVVLLSRRRLLPDMESFFRCLEPGREGSAGVLVTGPSRTADIEKELVVGVHGPKRLSVILTP